ncbi:MAG: hypothetical protein KAY37_07275 [Phycisphaerae bacterium]|nr:hypothetical protein [Phycisphaerae bacterium]
MQNLAKKLSDAEPRRFWYILLAAAVVPLLAVGLLFRLEVPLGCPGRFVYLYSPFSALRLRMVPIAVLIAIVLGLGTWLVSAGTARRRVGLVLITLGAAALAVWTYFAPPIHFMQHFFNVHSMSHDGAFAIEALHVQSVPDYLRAFPQHARTPPERMRGTRVISNPPGATLLAVGGERLLRAWPQLVELANRPHAHEEPPAEIRRSTAVGLVFFWTLIVLWLAAGPVLYLAGRLLLPPVVAATYSVCCVLSPATLLFTPGKDPAQLLTVAVPLYFWLLACRRGHVWAAVLAGVAFIPACLVSLVHIWIAAIVVPASLLSVRGSAAKLRRVLLRVFLPTVTAALFCGLGLYFLCDFDLLATARAVAQSQAEVTRGPDAMPLAWQLLGVPLFLLLAGPAWWAVMLWLGVAGDEGGRTRDSDARFGRYLLIGSAAIMLATIGFTNLETPRLWIPFVPLLLLGGLSQLALLRRPARRSAILLAVLVFAQITFSALQWSLMDMREAETRQVDKRLYG